MLNQLLLIVIKGTMKTLTFFIFMLVVTVLFAGCQPQTSPTQQPVQESMTQQSDESHTEQDQASNSDRYVAYNAENVVASAKTGKAVLFFHAAWCPTCQAAEKDIQSKLSEIPENITIFKTDYDTQTELKKKYDITYQHTFVQVDEQGNEIAKWNGGGVDEIITRVR